VSDLAGTVIARRYRLERLLGAGGMGEVWAAVDARLDRAVAVKILRSGPATDAGVRQRFESEARSAARLHHHNVVAIFDAGADAGDGESGRLWLVMERLPGHTLADRLTEGPMTSVEIRALADDVLAGLAAAHHARLVHRDIKPANLLRTADGTWKIADFGIAKPLDTPADLTMTGITIGTPSYLSPEQLEGRPATTASDVWAVGVVLYEALAGRKPFAGDTPFAVAHAARTVEPDPIAALRPDIDPALGAAITAALAKVPGDRPRDATAMAGMLATPPVQVGTVSGPPPSGKTIGAPTSARAVRPARATGGRSRLLLRVAAGLLLFAALVVAMVVGGVFHPDKPSPRSPATTSPTTAAVPTRGPPTSGPPMSSGTTAPPTSVSPTSSSAPATTTSVPSTTTSATTTTTTTTTTSSTTTPSTTGVTTTKPKKGGKGR